MNRFYQKLKNMYVMVQVFNVSKSLVAGASPQTSLEGGDYSAPKVCS